MWSTGGRHFPPGSMGLLVTHLTTDVAGMLTGEVSVSRLLDPQSAR